MLSRFSEFCDLMTTVAKNLIGLLMTLIVLITLAAVWTRYVMNAPISWTEQVSNMMFVWIVFIGAAVLYRQHLHIAVDMFLLMLPKNLQPVAFWIIETGNLLFNIVLFVFSLKLTIDVLPTTYGALDISAAYMYASAPVACLMMMIYFVEKIVDPTKRVPHGSAGDF